MLGAIRAEFRKFFSTRLWWGMAIAVVIVIAVTAIDMLSQAMRKRLL